MERSDAGLYKGAVLSGAAVVPYLAVSFSVYDHLKAQVKEDRTTRQLWWYPLAKIGMGATASTVAQVRVSRRHLCMTALRHSVLYC
jgi:hypothetical protein